MWRRELVEYGKGCACLLSIKQQKDNIFQNVAAFYQHCVCDSMFSGMINKLCIMHEAKYQFVCIHFGAKVTQYYIHQYICAQTHLSGVRVILIRG